ncbi:unnamed protein product [Hydatigera taeniaeformis]|uniref:Neurogenic protein mastermind-like n=1 Tax=Hydatigena taeniaeformis TaxID=6205 RepID=A0A0R3X2W4_HYDTA|nr:unnamed protein product [Hydatigera taeniaeformis]
MAEAALCQQSKEQIPPQQGFETKAHQSCCMLQEPSKSHHNPGIVVHQLDGEPQEGSHIQHKFEEDVQQCECKPQKTCNPHLNPESSVQQCPNSDRQASDRPHHNSGEGMQQCEYNPQKPCNSHQNCDNDAKRHTIKTQEAGHSHHKPKEIPQQCICEPCGPCNPHPNPDSGEKHYDDEAKESSGSQHNPNNDAFQPDCMPQDPGDSQYDFDEDVQETNIKPKKLIEQLQNADDFIEELGTNSQKSSKPTQNTGGEQQKGGLQDSATHLPEYFSKKTAATSQTSILKPFILLILSIFTLLNSTTHA